ncbi:unnamed protein product [Candidula unifasciata]|uniref:Uncharacterized protein n=1 Tax=Candidula unifasciata TaxID=100452 RepID=A0A8S3YNQ5_9EUPU|nr:unnamed protein product [Candidula unifasciata]
MDDSVDVQVTQSHFGAFVPQFLLKFQGDVSLQNYFRQLLKTNYQKGVVQLGFGHCQVCCSTLTYNDKPRLKPSQPMTRKVSTILSRSTKQSLGKYSTYVLQKFLRSSTQLTVRCPTCDTVNKRPLITNEAKLAVKEKLIKMSEMVTQPDTSEIIKKKKKRKKKKKKQRDNNSGLLIPGSVNEQKSSDADETLPNLPMDISLLSPLIPERFSTPLPTKGQIPNLATSASAKTPNRSVPAPAHFQKGAFSTPVNRNQSGSVSHIKQTASLKKGGNVQGSKKMKHKHLQEFLSQQSAAMATKAASLADFLSSL